MKAIANISVVSVTAQRDDAAPLLTQFLFGESMEVLDSKGDWLRVKGHFDGCEGWVNALQVQQISEEDFAKRQTELITTQVLFYNQGEDRYLLSLGSEVERENPEEVPTDSLRERIVAGVLSFLNVPSLAGGRSFFGVDAAALVQLVFKVNGVALPRFADAQATIGEALTFIEEAEWGDVAFFEDGEGHICHCGIMLEDQKIIHAHGKVRIDHIDSIGIFNKDLNKHTHKLRFVKKMISVG